MSLLHQLALTFIKHIGNATAKSLVNHFGEAGKVFEASVKDLMQVEGVGKRTADAIKNKEGFAEAEKELEFVKKYKLKTFCYSDPHYPKKLRSCYDAPWLLFYKGTADLNSNRIISVVGTRNSTSYGKELTEKLIADLSGSGILVVSGLAHGIDSIAHKACLREAVPTVGVLGHGLDRIYPAAHRSLAERMLADGGLLTEFPSETNPDRENFPKRNRIVAGIADATIVVEASIKGGALITAELANSYNRDVFSFPGRVDDEFSAGCNYLIKTNRAHLITGARDVQYLLGWEESSEILANKQLVLNLNLNQDEKMIFDLLNQKGSATIDDLALETSMAQSKLAVCVLQMEMQGIIVSLPGKVYKIL